MLHDGRFKITFGLPHGTAFPTDPPPGAGDGFYRDDLEKPYFYNGADWEEWCAAGDGGGPGEADFTFWLPDAPPLCASAYDDEFEDSAFDAVLWTEFDPGAFLTISEDEVGLILDMVTDPGADWAGIYQAIPSGDFAIVAKLALMALRTNYAYLSLLLWENATDNAKGLYSLSVFYDGSSLGVHAARWNNWQSWNSNLVTFATGNSCMYLRIRRSSTTYSFDISSDGVGWMRIWSGSLAFTPTHFGIGINNEGQGVTIRGVAHFFRYKDSSALTQILEGDRIDGWRS